MKIRYNDLISMTTQTNDNYIDVYEQVIDEDPGDDSFEVIADNQPGLFDEYEEIEEKAYEDLANSKRTRMTQTGGSVRTQTKRPFSQKLIKSL